MKRPVLAISLALSLCTGMARATDVPSTRPISPVVQPLLEAFNVDDFPTRQNAQRQLQQMGAPIEPELHNALDGDLTDEARARVEEILRHLSDQRDFGPSAITLHYKNAPAAKVLADLCKQAGTDLGLKDPNAQAAMRGKHITINLENAGFFVALRQATKGTGLALQAYGNDPAMTLGTNGSPIELNSPQAVASGAFFIIPQSATRQVGYGAGYASSLSLRLAVVAEPKLKIISGVNSDWLKECVDNNGVSLANTGPQQMFYNNNGRQWWWQLMANLQQPKEMGNKISKLRGEVHFTLQKSSETIDRTDMTQVRNITRVISGLTVTVENFTVNTNAPDQLRLTISGPNVNGRWDILQNFVTQMQVLDDQGQQLTNAGCSYEGGVGSITVTVSFNNDRRAAKFHWEFPTATKEISVPFELHNLELPHSR